MTIDDTTDTDLLVRTLLAKILNVDTARLSPQARLEDLGVDSLDMAELAAMLVDEGVQFDKAEAQQAATIADLVAVARPR